MLNKFRQKKEIIIIFVIFLVISFLDSCGNCILKNNISFDSQELLVWDYLSTTNLIPYKDYYYPYGLINILKNQSQLFFVIYSLILPLLFTSIFIFLKKIWKDNTATYISFITIVIFIYIVTGSGTFVRYGILVVAGVLYAYIFTNNKNISSKISFLLGLLNGIIFSLIYDQGVYSILLYSFILCVFPIVYSGLNQLKNKQYYIYLYNHILWFIIGFILTSSIFFAYLFLTNSFSGFISNITNLGDITKYAKTPYLHSLRSPDGIYNLLIILIAIVYVLYKFILTKVKKSFHFSAIIVLLVVLILLEQKSIIRSIDMQLTFISFILCNFLFYEFYIFLKKREISKNILLTYYILFFIASIFAFGLKLQNFQVVPYTMSSLSKKINTNFDAKSSVKDDYTQNLNNIRITHPEYDYVVNSLRSSSDFKDKIYSFPGDPIFYAMLKQKPPYYSAIYQASPLYAQNELIKYIENEKINYIVYNYNNFSIQDEVPNYIRVSALHKHILTNFSPVDRVDNFFILKRANEDIFINKTFNSTPYVNDYLINVNLENIPRSEGIYKKEYLKKQFAKKLFTSSTIKGFNSYLKKSDVDSRNKLLVLHLDNLNEGRKNMEIILDTKEGLSTKIQFNTCESQQPCIINLSQVPLLYESRILTKISSRGSENISIEIYDIKDDKYFW